MKKHQFIIVIFIGLLLTSMSCKESDIKEMIISEIDTIYIIDSVYLEVEELFEYDNTFIYNGDTSIIDSLVILPDTYYNSAYILNYRIHIGSENYHLNVITSKNKVEFNNYYNISETNTRIVSFKDTSLNYLTGYIILQGEISSPNIICEGYFRNQECKFNYSK